MKSDPIAELRSPSGSLISMFIERPAPGGFGARISDLGRTVRTAAETRNRDVVKSVDSDLQRIRGMAETLEMEAVPAYAVFASDIDDIFTIQPLTHPVTSTAVLGARPYMRPLRAVPRPTRAGILVADRTRARTFIAFDGSLEELGDSLEVDVGKPNFGGFGGYDEHGVRARAHDASKKMWREAGQRLLERHFDSTLDFVSIGGHEEMFDDIRSELHPYLAELRQLTFVASPQAVTPAMLREQLAVQRALIRERAELALADEVLAAASRQDRGLVGLRAVLDAANIQSISDLVVAGEFSRPGVMCSQCGWIDRDGEQCPVCTAALLGVPDVVSAVMDSTIAHGGKVHQLSVGSRLDRDGIGALTRF